MIEITPEIEDFIIKNIHSNLNDVLLILAKKDWDASFIVNQINGRKKIAQKIPSWKNKNFIYPSITSLEQCSSQATAQYKSSLTSGDSMVDLTGGFGVDSYFFSKNFKTVDYFERNVSLAKVVEHNFKKSSISNISIRAENGIPFLENLEKKINLIYIDPARRNEQNSKVFLIKDCSPNIEQHFNLFEKCCQKLMIKFSPILDITAILHQLPKTQTVYIVSVKNEVKEILLFFDFEKPSQPVKIHCVDLDKLGQIQSQFISKLKVTDIIEYTYPQSYIYEPNKTILKAGIQNSLAKEFSLYKLHPNSHLFTSNKLIKEFPGRVFFLENSFGVNKKTIKKFLPSLKANIIVRNFPLNAEQIHKKFRIVSGGENYLLATTLKKNEKTFLNCNRIQ